jgi:hypothetical protein
MRARDRSQGLDETCRRPVQLCGTTDDDAFIFDQVLPLLLQTHLRVALRRFVRAELSRGQ